MRLSGIARGSRATLLERTTVTTDSGPLGSVEELAPFEIELDDGHRVRVELAQHLRIQPIESRDAEWQDLEEDPAFSSLRSKAPGPHVRVKVSRARLQEGMRVELLAEDDAEYVFAIATSHRDAPERKLAKVTARAIATGEHAADVLDGMLAPAPKPIAKRPKRRERQGASKLTATTSKTPFVLVGIAFLFFYAASSMKLSPLSVDLAAIGVTLVSAALSSWALSRVPRFVSDGRVIGRLSDVEPGRIVLFALVLPLTFMAFAAFDDHDPDSLVYNASWSSLVFLAAWSLLIAYIAFTRGSREARLFRVLLGAPKLPDEGELHRTWGAFEGVVRDPTPVTAEGEAVAIVHVISEEVQSGSDPNIYTERVLSKGTFFVDAPDESERSIEIHPDGAVWTSSVALKVKKPGNDRVIEHVRAVPLRGNVLVAGRVDRKAHSKVGRVASGGHESLLFVAVREGESPRAECYAMLFLRRVALAIALGTFAVAVGTMIVIEPKLPSFNLRGD
jgi:hypothetical protein